MLRGQSRAVPVRTEQRAANATPRGSARLLKAVASIAIVAAAWAALALLIWNLNRGFDLTDEATLLYLYRHPDSFLDRLYLHHFRLISALFGPALDHIVYYRLIKLIGLLAFTAAFAALLAGWIGRRFRFVADVLPRPIVFAHFLMLGSFLAYCHGSQTLSYNDLVTFCLLAVAACCFALDVPPCGFRPLLWRPLVSLPIGATFAIVFPIKWSVAPLLVAWHLVFVCAISADRSPAAIAASVAGAVAAAAFTLFATSDFGIGRVFSISKLIGVLQDGNSLGTHADAWGLLAMYTRSSAERLAPACAGTRRSCDARAAVRGSQPKRILSRESPMALRRHHGLEQALSAYEEIYRDAIANNEPVDVAQEARELSRLMREWLPTIDGASQLATDTLRHVEADSAARLEQIHTLHRMLKESEADRAAHLEQVDVLLRLMDGGRSA